MRYMLLIVFVFVPGVELFDQVRKLYGDKWPFAADCGQTRYEPDDENSMRIIHGEVACLGEFPWMVRLGIHKGYYTDFRCGGSLVSRYYVISVAHCQVCDMARFGENYVDTDEDCDNTGCAPKPQDIKIKEFINHHNYSSYREYFDYALVELEKPVQFNDFVQPICFPSEPIPHKFLKSELLAVAGWGLINVTEYIFADKLMHIYAPLIKSETCNVALSKTLMDHQLCIGYERGRDSCGGDSGGPVFKNVYKDGVPRAYLVAVVSYGLAECGEGPAVYSDVGYFANWTLSNIRRL